MLCQGQVLAADGTRQAPHLTQHPTLSTAGTCLAGAPLVFTDAESTSVDIPETFFAGAMRRARPASAIRVSDEGFEAAKCN